MSLVRVKAVFWRRVLEASHKTLHGEYAGQYHITVPVTVSDDLLTFLGELPRYGPTENNGFSIDIPIEGFDGLSPVPPQSLKIRYMGADSARKDWNFPAQSTEPYPLWAPNRGVPDVYNAAGREYIMLIKDDSGRFHARWQHGTSDLPEPLRLLLEANESGVWEVDS